jgi:hypothetical protein
MKSNGALDAQGRPPLAVATLAQSLRVPRDYVKPLSNHKDGDVTAIQAHNGGMSESGHRSCKCGAVYDRSEHIAEAREISSFECAVCGETIENWNSAWVPRYRFIACPARDAE